MMMGHHHEDDRDSWEWPRHALSRIEEQLTQLHHQMQHGFDRTEGFIMAASQADIDALTAQLSTLKNSLEADDAAIQAELSRLASQGVDVSALQSALSDLSGQVDATTALVPAVDPNQSA